MGTTRRGVLVAVLIALAGLSHSLSSQSEERQNVRSRSNYSSGSQGGSTSHRQDLPELVREFRDDGRFYDRLMGIRENRPRVSRGELDAYVAGADPAYRAYLREQLEGFIAEYAGRLDSARAHYEKAFLTPISEQESLYADVDLARLDLKSGNLGQAEFHLARYTRFIASAIRAGEGGLVTEYTFGYVPSEEVLPVMRSDLSCLENVLHELRQLVKTEK